jgi:hypothetical protein
MRPALQSPHLHQKFYALGRRRDYAIRDTKARSHYLAQTEGNRLLFDVSSGHTRKPQQNVKENALTLLNYNYSIMNKPSRDVEDSLEFAMINALSARIEQQN